MRTRRVCLFPLLLAVAACRNPVEVSDCPDQVTITVSAGTTPEIDWTPRCHLYALSMYTPWGNETIWSIHGPPELLICPDDGRGCPTPLNTLYPPIRFGVVPEDAFQAFPLGGGQPSSLRPGWPYTVYVYRGNDRAPFLAVDTFVVDTTLGQ